MKDAKIVDFIAHIGQPLTEENMEPSHSPEELINAIQHLIQRLRDHKPLKQTG